MARGMTTVAKGHEIPEVITTPERSRDDMVNVEVCGDESARAHLTRTPIPLQYGSADTFPLRLAGQRHWPQFHRWDAGLVRPISHRRRTKPT